MSQTYSIVFMALLVIGCSAEPTDEQYVDARTWCDNFGGIKIITFSKIGGLRVRCMDSKLIIDDTSD